MKLIKKIDQVALQIIPILIIIVLIPFIENDYLLSLAFIVIMVISFSIKYDKHDFIFLVFGFFAMIAFESLLVMAGVETFTRKTLFRVMPIWLPILWAYAFVAIRRGIKILESK